MPQIHFYLDESSANALKARAKARGLSVSRFVAERLRPELEAAWPSGYFERVVGGWAGPPPERPAQGECETRDRWPD